MFAQKNFKTNETSLFFVLPLNSQKSVVVPKSWTYLFLFNLSIHFYHKKFLWKSQNISVSKNIDEQKLFFFKFVRYEDRRSYKYFPSSLLLREKVKISNRRSKIVDWNWHQLVNRSFPFYFSQLFLREQAHFSALALWRAHIK